MEMQKKLRELHWSDILPYVMVLVFFAYSFIQLMYVMYGQTVDFSAKKSSSSVRIVYPQDIEYPPDGINPNTADLETLCLLPGVGKVTAQAFHDELALNGAFHYPEDILSVKGIGEKKLEKIRFLITLP